MTRSLVALFDQVEAVEYWSTKLVTDTEEDLSKDWIAWTGARNKKSKLVESSEELKTATMQFGKSLSSLYSMFNIHNPQLLNSLTGLYALKAGILAEPIAMPEIRDISTDPKKGILILYSPKDEESIARYLEDSASREVAEKLIIQRVFK